MILKYLFFLGTPFFMALEILHVVLFDEMEEVTAKLKNATHKDDLHEERGFLLVWNTLELAYLFWIVTGLFSSQWVIFLVLLIMGGIPKSNKTYTHIDSMVSLCLLVFAVINAFHLHIDLGGMVINYLKSVIYG